MAKMKPLMSSSPPDTDPAGVVSAEAGLQNPATLSDLLAVRSYLWFWIGRVCNSLSVQIQAIALAWQVYAVARQSRLSSRPRWRSACWASPSSSRCSP
jgi:hypothetical protein